MGIICGFVVIFLTWHLTTFLPEGNFSPQWDDRNPAASLSVILALKYSFFYVICSPQMTQKQNRLSQHLHSQKQEYIKASNKPPSGVLVLNPPSNYCSQSFYSAEHGIAEKECHTAYLNHSHTLFNAHYYLSITCNYPSRWLMGCFRGWVGKQLGLSCWGLDTII